MLRDQEIVIGAIRRSRAFGVVNRLRLAVVAASQTSAVRGLWRGAPHQQHNGTSGRFFGGVMVLTATILHLVMLLTLGEYRGWRMLILPAVTALLALIAIATGVPKRRSLP